MGYVKGLWGLEDMLWVGRCCQKKRGLTATGHVRWFLSLKDMLWDGNCCQKRRVLTAIERVKWFTDVLGLRILPIRSH